MPPPNSQPADTLRIPTGGEPGKAMLPLRRAASESIDTPTAPATTTTQVLIVWDAGPPEPKLGNSTRKPTGQTESAAHNPCKYRPPAG